MAAKRRSQRLTQRRDFTAVYRHGRPFRGEFLALRALATGESEPSRFGLAVGRDVGGAVVRNRVKRRLREAVRSLPVAAGWKVVIRARPRVAAATYRDIRSDLAALLGRAGMVRSGGSD